MEDQEFLGPLAAGFEFHSAAIRQRDLIYVSTTFPPMQLKSLPFATFLDHNGIEFGLIGDTRWDCVSICSPTIPKSQMVALGEYGQVMVFGSDDEYEERVTTEDVEFREVRAIAGIAYACAMDRKVFRRDAPHRWIPVHQDMHQRPAPDIVFGFESIHGYSHDNLYAVGWHGEIWHYDGDAWQQQQSPTNLTLNRVYCAPDGFVYACGLAGTLIRGRDSQWEIIADGAISADLWDMDWFCDRLWISSLNMIYTLEGDTPEPVEFNDDAPTTFFQLDARDGILWSVGREDIMQFDGEEWHRIA